MFRDFPFHDEPGCLFTTEAKSGAEARWEGQTLELGGALRKDPQYIS